MADPVDPLKHVHRMPFEGINTYYNLAKLKVYGPYTEDTKESATPEQLEAFGSHFNFSRTTGQWDDKEVKNKKHSYAQGSWRSSNNSTVILWPTIEEGQYLENWISVNGALHTAPFHCLCAAVYVEVETKKKYLRAVLAAMTTPTSPMAGDYVFWTKELGGAGAETQQVLGSWSYASVVHQGNSFEWNASGTEAVLLPMPQDGAARTAEQAAYLVKPDSATNAVLELLDVPAIFGGASGYSSSYIPVVSPRSSTSTSSGMDVAVYFCGYEEDRLVMLYSKTTSSSTSVTTLTVTEEGTTSFDTRTVSVSASFSSVLAKLYLDTLETVIFDQRESSGTDPLRTMTLLYDEDLTGYRAWMVVAVTGYSYTGSVVDTLLPIHADFRNRVLVFLRQRKATGMSYRLNWTGQEWVDSVWDITNGVNYDTIPYGGTVPPGWHIWRQRFPIQNRIASVDFSNVGVEVYLGDEFFSLQGNIDEVYPPDNDIAGATSGWIEPTSFWIYAPYLVPSYSGDSYSYKRGGAVGYYRGCTTVPPTDLFFSLRSNNYPSVYFNYPSGLDSTLVRFFLTFK